VCWGGGEAATETAAWGRTYLTWWCQLTFRMRSHSLVPRGRRDALGCSNTSSLRAKLFEDRGLRMRGGRGGGRTGVGWWAQTVQWWAGVRASPRPPPLQQGSHTPPRGVDHSKLQPTPQPARVGLSPQLNGAHTALTVQAVGLPGGHGVVRASPCPGPSPGPGPCASHGAGVARPATSTRRGKHARSLGVGKGGRGVRGAHQQDAVTLGVAGTEVMHILASVTH
jgi:hypothetical protein